MKIKEIVQVLEGDIHCEGSSPDKEVKMACASDLMSDVLAFSKCEAALLTGLINPQVIRTAEMMDVVCVVFVRDKEPTQAVIDLATKLGIAIITTKFTMYYASGLLYKAGLGLGHEHGGCHE